MRRQNLSAAYNSLHEIAFAVQIIFLLGARHSCLPIGLAKVSMMLSDLPAESKAFMGVSIIFAVHVCPLEELLDTGAILSLDQVERPEEKL